MKLTSAIHLSKIVHQLTLKSCGLVINWCLCVITLTIQFVHALPTDTWLGMYSGHVSIMSFHTNKLSKKQGWNTEKKFNPFVDSDLDIFNFFISFFSTAEVSIASVIVKAVDRENHISVWSFDDMRCITLTWFLILKDLNFVCHDTVFLQIHQGGW